TVVLWRGRVLYANGKSWAIWARVKLGVQRDQWVAAGEIPAGATIAPGEMRLEPARVFPFGEAALEPQNAAGRTARRRIEKDQVITAGLLLPRNDVKRGDEVEVRVESGAATLRVHARAETSGRIGQPVMVKNPASGRNFRALVEGKGRVGVMADTGSTR
ncbi:MAG TPA: flagellar basal body P-ring formation chaperone FlgA, partial [Bryobacteraceae bacterium]|nr:flagellar basal body P-ring formation chaperone FlgA [Bryobacteraceae bacterium]